MKKEKRSLFQTIFGRPQSEPAPETSTYLQMLNSYNPIYNTVSPNIYDNKVARTCIDRIATHCAKMIPKHIKGSINNVVNLSINRLLQNRPNPLMNTYDFLYKVISNLYTNSNSFVYIQKENGLIKAFYPIMASSYQLFQNSAGEIYLQFIFVNRSNILYTLLGSYPFKAIL